MTTSKIVHTVLPVLTPAGKIVYLLKWRQNACYIGNVYLKTDGELMQWVQCIDHGEKNGLADGLGVSLTFCKESTSKDSKWICLLKVASQFWKNFHQEVSNFISLLGSHSPVTAD